jgi:hypothetical protein
MENNQINNDNIKCVVCKNPIAQEALKCIHCNSYQDWKRYIFFSNSVLALLIALVSVLTVAIPVLSNSFKSEEELISISVVDVKSDLILLAINSGTRPGVVKPTAKLTIFTENTDKLTLHLRHNTESQGDFSNLIVSPNNSVMLYAYSPYFFFSQNDTDKNKKCVLEITIIRFDSSTRQISRSFECSMREDPLIKYNEQILEGLINPNTDIK